MRVQADTEDKGIRTSMHDVYGETLNYDFTNKGLFIKYFISTAAVLLGMVRHGVSISAKYT